MSTSGVTSFNSTRNDLIKGALRLIGVLASGETPSASDISDCSEALNLMVKGWMPEAHLWSQTQATLFLVAGQRQYAFPGANATKTYVETTLTADAAALATSLTVSSITGINNGDFIGILLDNNALHWTTVNGIPAGSTVVITTGLPTAASSGRYVYAYTTKIERPLRIYNLRRQDLQGNEIPFYPDILARQDYLQLPNKTATGTPIQGWYDPQLTTGQLFLWPTPSDSTNKITFTYERTIEDFLNIGDNPDFPQEWLNAIKWNLAIEIAPEYTVSPSAYIIEKASELKEIALSWDTDKGSLFVSPECQ